MIPYGRPVDLTGKMRFTVKQGTLLGSALVYVNVVLFRLLFKNLLPCLLQYYNSNNTKKFDIYICYACFDCYFSHRWLN